MVCDLDEIKTLNTEQLTKLYQTRELSPCEVVVSTLERMHQVQEEFNAFQCIDAQLAKTQAKESEKRWRSGTPLSALDGIPIPIKDLVDLKGLPTRHGSLTGSTKALSEDASCVARLREAGALLFAKTTTPEFGWKGMTDGPLFGYTANPYNKDHTSGGSSGGAAVSVATGCTPIAHGNDGGGSIRIPASYCGVVGIKPNFGRVADYPRGGAYDTLSSEGPLCRTAKDAALFLNEVSRPDLRDASSIEYSRTDFGSEVGKDLKGLRIAVCTNLGGIEASPEISEAIVRAAHRFEDAGAIMDSVGNVFDSLRPVFERYWLGGLYQRIAAIPEQERGNLDPDLLRIAREGENVTLSEFSAGVSARMELTGKMQAFHQQFDLLLTPTMPTDPPAIKTTYHSETFDRWRDATPYTVPFNLTGQPAASVPCGVSKKGFPIGLQIIGGRFSEPRVLQACDVFEKMVPYKFPYIESVK